MDTTYPDLSGNQGVVMVGFSLSATFQGTSSLKAVPNSPRVSGYPLSLKPVHRQAHPQPARSEPPYTASASQSPIPLVGLRRSFSSDISVAIDDFGIGHSS